MDAFNSRAQEAALCSNFTVTGSNNYTRASDLNFPVSKGVVCNGTSACPVAVGGYVTVHRTTNLTNDSPDWVFDLINDTTGISFQPSLVGAVDNTTYTVPVGSFGYIGFTPDYRCTQGRLSNCTSKDLEDRPVEACTPFADDKGLINGSLAIVNTSPEAALAISCNLANTSLASGNSTSTCVFPQNASAGNATGSGKTSGGGVSSSVGTVFLCVALLVAAVGV